MLLTALALTAGCAASTASRADDAFKHARYLEAADLYDQVVHADPKNNKAVVKRFQARNAALSVLLTETSQARVAGRTEDALVKLAEMLARRDAWAMRTDANVDRQLTVEVVAAGNAIDTAVTRTASSVGPLSAEELFHHYAPLLAHADFATWRQQIDGEVHKSGKNACTALAPRATTPYWSWVVASYCSHFGGQAIRMLARPNLRSSLAVDGSIGGVSPDDAAHVRTTLADAFRESVWFLPDAARSAHATLGGRIAVNFEAHTVSRTANWTEQVPYTDYVTEQESYQEPYDDTESYQEQVPHTEYRTETHPCGDTTCTDTHPETVYSSESRTRTVTKYRTAYRSVTKPVTKYRDVPRSFTYEALERTGHYASAVRVRLDRDLDVAADITGDFIEHGFDHDVSNAAAGVSPERANLPTLADFLSREEGRLKDELKARLDARYGELYCASKQYTLEEAAACAYLAPGKVPDAVHAALRGAFGADETFLPAVLAR
jgi:hypothetical protein